MLLFGMHSYLSITNITKRRKIKAKSSVLQENISKWFTFIIFNRYFEAFLIFIS